MYPIYAYGSDEQKNKWLPKMATGRWSGCFGLTEADFGSNPSGMLTTARKDGDSYVLNGSKMWITNGGVAHIAIVWAKLEGRHPRLHRRSAARPGYSTKDIHGKFSLRASVTSELTFQDCRIPRRTSCPTWTGSRARSGCLNQARYGIAWGGIGAAMACYHEALEYSKTRIQFDRPIAGFQMVQEKLAWMIREITKGQLLVLQVGRLKDAGKVKPEQVSLAKMNNVDVGSSARDSPAPSSARTGSRTSTSAAATCAIWRASTRTRAPTTSTPSSWAKRSRGFPRTNSNLPRGKLLR
jgi:glutaryl-CoA dehydrogenase